MDQPNGLKMSFDMSTPLDSINAANLVPSPWDSIDDGNLRPSTSVKSGNRVSTSNITPNASAKRSRKKPSIDADDTNAEPPSLPTYCDLIVQGLQSRDSFPAIQKIFLDQTSAHFLGQYPDGASKNIHHSFVLALTQKYPALNYLDVSVDGKRGKAPHHTISQLLSRKKRNMRYAKTHPPPKRQRVSTLDSNLDDQTVENAAVVESPPKESVPDPPVRCVQEDLPGGSSIEDLFDDPNPIRACETVNGWSDPKGSTAAPAPSKTPIRAQSATKNDRRATVSLVPQPTSSITNARSLSTNPIIVKSITPNSQIKIAAVPSKSIITVRRAILPQQPPIQQVQNRKNSCTSSQLPPTPVPSNILQVSSITNTEQPNTTSNPEIWFPKLSKSEQSAYSKDISRLRSIVKPKNRSNNPISIGEIHALIRNSHAIRRRTLSQKGDVDFNTKVLQYQEIFHEEALIHEYTLLKDRGCTFEDVQDKARALLDGLIGDYSIASQQQMSEADFLAMKAWCEDSGEQSLFFKNGLTDPHPIIGILITPSASKEFEKAWLFIRNLPYKMTVSIGGGGLHRALTLLLVAFINLNQSPTHKLLRLLLERCEKNNG